MTDRVVVHKLDNKGLEVFRYSAVVLRRMETGVVLEAIFDMDDRDFHGLTFRRGDRFVEFHFSDRWYNVLAIYDVDSGDLKGWYCNISRPAAIDDATITAEDLALDLVVLPDGNQFVLDEDEYADLNLDSADQAEVLAALRELQQYAETLSGPFEMDPRS